MDARISGTVIFLFWGAFFVHHFADWIITPFPELPPPVVWITLTLHLAMLSGFIVALKWEVAGSVLVILASFAFFMIAMGEPMIKFFSGNDYPHPAVFIRLLDIERELADHDMKYRCEVTIDTPRDRVIELFDNPDNMSKWQPGAKSRLIYNQKGRRIEMIETIIRRELPDEFTGTYRAKGVENWVSNRFMEEESGQTRCLLRQSFNSRASCA